GGGCWSRGGGQVGGATWTGLAAWWLAPWKPLGRFAWAWFREMARFGRHMVAGNLLGLLGSYLDNIVVGRWLGAEALGLYGTAFRWGRLPSQALGTTANQVAFPSYVAVQAEPARLKAAYLRVLHTVRPPRLGGAAGPAPRPGRPPLPPALGREGPAAPDLRDLRPRERTRRHHGGRLQGRGAAGMDSRPGRRAPAVARRRSLVPHRLRARRCGLRSPARDARLRHGGAHGHVPPPRCIPPGASRHARTARG